MTVLLILVAVLVVILIVLAVVARRRRVASRTRRDEEIRASLTEPPAPEDAAPPSGDTDGPMPATADDPIDQNDQVDPWASPHGEPDPAGPPAAIHMTVTGTDPWNPARAFVAELTSEGYETTVELPDLVVARDEQRLPITVREQSGPPGHLIVITTPEVLARTLESLVRSLLATSYTVDATDGRNVELTDGDDIAIRLTVTELALA